MKYEKSEWYKGLLFAEEQSAQGWIVHAFDYDQSWFMWAWENSFEAKQTYFGTREWLQGVLDYYQNKNQRNDEPFQYLDKEFQEVLDDNFWGLVLK
jgi:hypothetical protein